MGVGRNFLVNQRLAGVSCAGRPGYLVQIAEESRAHERFRELTRKRVSPAPTLFQLSALVRKFGDVSDLRSQARVHGAARQIRTPPHLWNPVLSLEQARREADDKWPRSPYSLKKGNNSCFYMLGSTCHARGWKRRRGGMSARVCPGGRGREAPRSR